MGTRGLVGIKIGRTKKYTYNHFDSYPSGLGKEVVEFCHSITKADAWEAFKEKAKAVKMVKQADIPSGANMAAYLKYHNGNVSSGEITEWYSLLREVQGVNTLIEIASGNLKHLIDNKEFIKESLFCEYAYVINLTTMKLEMYEGFQKKGKGYGSCKKVAEFPLTDIPEDWETKAFPKDEDDE